MPTVIDSLIVLLNLDASKFTEGQKKALDALRKTKDETRSSGNDIEAWGKRSAAAFTMVQNQVLRLATLFLGGLGIKDFTAQQTEAGAATGRLAKNIGLSTHAVALWEQAVRLFGGSGEEAGASMQGLTNEMQKFALTGESSIVPVFRRLNIALTDSQGKLRSITDIYLDLADRFSRMSPQEANALGRMLGLDQGTINLLDQGLPKVRAFLDQAERAGVLSDRQSGKLQKLQTSWENFSAAMVTVGRDLLTSAAPSIEKSLDGIADALERNQEKTQRIAKDASTGSMIGAVLGFLFGGVKGATVGATAGGAAGAGYGITESAARDKAARDAALGMYVDPSGYVFALPSSKLTLFDLIQQLENSAAGAVSAKGAIGRNQIMPGTAKQYGFDPSRLGEPAYNDMVARAIEADLYARYKGDPDAIAIAYNAGPGAADRFLANGRNLASLPQETQRYVERERSMTGGGLAQNVTIGTVIVNSKATDGRGLARDFRNELSSPGALVTQSNAGPQ